MSKFFHQVEKQPQQRFSQRYSWKIGKIHWKAFVLAFVFFNKVENLMPATLLKKRLQHVCFSINLAKFLGTPFNRTPSSD